MQKQPLGCITTTGIITAILVALAIFGVWSARGGAMFNPAPLSTNRGPTSLGGVYTHAEILRIPSARIPSSGNIPPDGMRNDCSACHTAPWEKTSSTERCMVCHQNLAGAGQSGDNTAGNTPGGDRANFYAIMVAQTKHNACIDCHTEHQGEDGELTKMDLTNFDHLGSGFALQSHKKTAQGEYFTCNECHPQGFTTFDPGLCIACHTQQDAAFIPQHSSLYGSDCLACHDGMDRYGKNFDHNQENFKLQGKHGELDCTACHENARSSQDLYNTPNDCYSCHVDEDNHQGEHGEKCDFCHSDVSWAGANPNHEQTLLPLVGAHLELECGDCHPERSFERTPTHCYGCHQEDDEHDGRYGQTCSTCHKSTAWKEAEFLHNFEMKAHGGVYAQNECKRCHGDVFRSTPSECEDCHDQPEFHREQFSDPCRLCHTPDGWSPAKFSQEHSFPMDHGKEVASACKTCHPNSVKEYTCYGCHEHNQAEIEARYIAQGIPDFKNCTRCHPTGAVKKEQN